MNLRAASKLPLSLRRVRLSALVTGLAHEQVKQMAETHRLSSEKALDVLVRLGARAAAARPELVERLLAEDGGAIRAWNEGA